jgi:hypothetical protein
VGGQGAPDLDEDRMPDPVALALLHPGLHPCRESRRGALLARQLVQAFRPDPRPEPFRERVTGVFVRDRHQFASITVVFLVLFVVLVSREVAPT